MVDKTQYDFGGYVTKNNIVCSDGRTILRDAFKDCDGMEVPLVWHHLHEEPSNVLGHVLLENREDGVYGYGKFNDTANGMTSKKITNHRDVKSLSIYANQLLERSKNVLHGLIREVSLVMAGANPGAHIDYLSFEHSDEPSETDALVQMNLPIDYFAEEPVVEHADPTPADTKVADEKEETVGDVFDTLDEKQKNAVYIIVAQALEAAKAESPAPAAETKPADSTKDVKHSDEGEKETMTVKHNVFEDGKEGVQAKNTLSHDDFVVILEAAKKGGSLKDAFLAHDGGAGVDYGIDHPEYLFPDARALSTEPKPITRRMAWVKSFMSQTNHSPFSRVKTVVADLTADEVRGRGYVKGNMKTDALLKLLRRTTTPTTVYHKQKLDREDIIDITDFDVIVWMKKVGRVALDEEVARAGLIGDGRSVESVDRISEESIRPIYKDDDMYVERVQVAIDEDAEDIMDAIIGSMEEYFGSGSLVMYTTTSFVTSMLLLRSTDGRKLYPTRSDIASALGITSIVEVPVMKNVERTTDGGTNLHLIAILVDPSDYTFGADKGGEVNTFDQFDIDFNQQKTLSETRVSGALTLPKSAIVVEQVGA